MRYCLTFIVILGFVSSCANQEEAAPALSVIDYLPLKVGAFHVYSVEETITDQVSGETTSIYELKTFVSDSFPDPEGNLTYVIQRLKRDNSQSPWANLPTWSARISGFQAIINEENTSYLKIQAPIAESKAWNGNLPNTMEDDTYSMVEVGVPYAIDPANSFANTITILQNDNKDLIVFQDKRSEVYAKTIGLVYREILQLEYCTDPNCLGQQKVNKGLKYKQTIKEYGGL